MRALRPNAPAETVIGIAGSAFSVITGQAVRPLPHRLNRRGRQDRAERGRVKGRGKTDEIDGRGDPGAVSFVAFEVRGAIRKRHAFAVRGG